MPAERQPGRASESPRDGSEVTSAMGASRSKGTTSRSGARLGNSFRGPLRGVRGEFFRYVVVGGIAFVCDAGTLFALTRFLKVNYLISAPIGFTLGIVVNYLLSRTWVFERRRLQNTPVEVTIFTLIGVVGLGLTN